MPISVVEMIELLDEAIEVAGNPESKKDVLNDILDPMSLGKDAELDPGDFLNDEQTQTILKKLIILTSVEEKASYATRTGLRAARVTALERIALWASGTPRLSPIFSSVGRYEIAVQMAFRVRRPSSMNQGPQGFCGPASVLVPMLRDRPSDYVEFVIALFETGVARFLETDIDVRAAQALRSSWFAERGPEADYVALGSLRYSVEAIVSAPTGGGYAFDFLNNDSHATTPDQIAMLLSQAGYRNVQNRALTDYTAPRGKMGLISAGFSLTNCSNLFSQTPGSVVIMLVHGVLASHAKRNVDIAGEAHVSHLSELHWILVRRMDATGLFINPPTLTGRVKMKLYTWKWSGPADFALADFLPRYYGYISAEPA